MQKLKQLYKGYIFFFIKYFSVKKVFNLIYNSFELKQKRVYLNSVPPILHIDVSNICVLHCPLCPTGQKDKSQIKKTISFEEFKPIFDKFRDYIFFIWLYNWGEPFICNDIFKIIDYCHKNKVGVKIDSNLNYYNDEIIKNIVKHQVDYLSLSIDGASQINYQYYRKDGDLNKVLRGIEKIIDQKKKYQLKYPYIIWQFLINNENLLEVENARLLSKKIGVDFISYPLSLRTQLDFKFKNKEYEGFLSKTGVSRQETKNLSSPEACRYLWTSLVVNPSKTFAPCPIIYKDIDNFGVFDKQMLTKSIKEIYNSKTFMESRKLFTLKNYKPKVKTACERCHWFSKPN